MSCSFEEFISSAVDIYNQRRTFIANAFNRLTEQLPVAAVNWNQLDTAVSIAPIDTVYVELNRLMFNPQVNGEPIRVFLVLRAEKERFRNLKQVTQTLAVLMPEPPLPCNLYSLTSVLLP